MVSKKIFFLHDELHREFGRNRGKDIIYTWNFKQERRITYSLTEVLKNKRPGFSTSQVAQMLNRHPIIVSRAVERGMVPYPQYSYSLETRNKKMRRFVWGEKDILILLDYFATVHYGRPRRDGMVVPKELPTPRELRAIINNEDVLYMKQGDQFVPTWRAKEI